MLDNKKHFFKCGTGGLDTKLNWRDSLEKYEDHLTLIWSFQTSHRTLILNTTQFSRPSVR